MIVTGIGHARNLAVVASGDAVIAVGGRWGTLAEIGFARTLGRYVVILEPGWELEDAARPRAVSGRYARARREERAREAGGAAVAFRDRSSPA